MIRILPWDEKPANHPDIQRLETEWSEADEKARIAEITLDRMLIMAGMRRTAAWYEQRERVYAARDRRAGIAGSIYYREIELGLRFPV